jgi:hypothetical protein
MEGQRQRPAGEDTQILHQPGRAQAVALGVETSAENPINTGWDTLRGRAVSSGEASGPESGRVWLIREKLQRMFWFDAIGPEKAYVSQSQRFLRRNAPPVKR